MENLIAPFLNGTAQGGLLLIAALGLALTFGQMGVINMAHGEFLLAGALCAYWTQQVIANTNLSILLALPIAFLFAGCLGLILEVSVIQWMYQRPLGHVAGHRRREPRPSADGPPALSRAACRS